MDDDIEAQKAERLLLDHDDTVVGYVVPLDSPGLDPQGIDAFLTGDCPEIKVERILELVSAESQHLVATAAAAMKTRSSRRHQKRRRDTADDDIDTGGARGAPQRTTVTAEGARLSEHLEPAPRDDGSRQEGTVSARGAGLPHLLKSTEKIHRSPLPSDAITALAHYLHSNPPSFSCGLHAVFLPSGPVPAPPMPPSPVTSSER
ncbi:GPI transamidase component PIG-S [Panicum miliaceum]|uniref:GPI transamidase component PIG-S n=1 Tax=Panicum miliaceum TaxID=4540 RepID=A0A3L6RIT7_PANMI|nr:GPI transamidase component PIG-S [Panicum miliaceum]